MEQKENYYRPSWDDYFMAITRIVATRSTCDRLRSGAILVKNNRIISTGYNGSPPGLPHCDGEAGHLMEEGHCVRTIHGEHNTILQAAAVGGISTAGSTMYATYNPCVHCAKYVVAVGIKRVVVGKIYRGGQSLQYLKDAGVQVDIYVENNQWAQSLQELFKKEIETMIAKEGDVQVKIEK